MDAAISVQRIYARGMRLFDLVTASNGVAGVSGRLDKLERLAAFLSRVPPEQIPIAVAFLSGTSRQGRIGLGGRAIAQAAIGEASAPSLTLLDVDEGFERIARVVGRGAASERVRLLGNLLSRATSAERDFLVRLLFGELRQGALEGVLIDAVARAAGIPAAAVRRATMLAGDFGRVASAAMTGGEAALGQFAVTLLRPVQPMLADTAEDVSAALARLGEAALEYKLDGARIQAHKAGDEVRIFSRNLRDVTAAIPEVVEAVRALPADDAILDGEVIGLRHDGAPLPFQVTMRRFGRKLDVDRLRRDIPVRPFFFDLLQRDGRVEIDAAQADRFEALQALVPSHDIVPHVRTADGSRAASFVAEAIERGHEGVMAKAPGAPYAAGSRGQAWLKIKQAHTLDLVVLAAEWGHGRRRGWLSNLHLGARDETSGTFVMLGKTFKGLTDDLLAWQTEALRRLETSSDHYTVFVRPELVVEVAFNDVQESPQYPGGLALRFARVKRYRPDKAASDADTFATVQAIYRQATGGRDTETRERQGER
jgi:DNA ligase-1